MNGHVVERRNSEDDSGVSDQVGIEKENVLGGLVIVEVIEDISWSVLLFHDRGSIAVDGGGILFLLRGRGLSPRCNTCHLSCLIVYRR